MVTLGKEVPSLAKVSGRVLSGVTIDQIQYRIESTLNVPLPPVDLYIAPGGAASASAAGAVKLGTLPGRAAGFSGKDVLKLDAEAQRAFAGFATDFQTPCVFIASTQVVVRAGTPVPQGDVRISVTGTVSAKL
jgi:hypothetical protein